VRTVKLLCFWVSERSNECISVNYGESKDKVLKKNDFLRSVM